MDEHLGLRSLDQITVKDIVNILDEYKEKGHNRMGQIFRKVVIDLLKRHSNSGTYQLVLIQQKQQKTSCEDFQAASDL